MVSPEVVVEMVFGRRGSKETMQPACACQVASNKVPGMLALYHGVAEWTAAGKQPYRIQPSAPGVNTNTLVLCFSKVLGDNSLFPSSTEQVRNSTIRGAALWLT